MAVNDTPWAGQGAGKLYLQSGQFTSTVKTSEYIGGVDAVPIGISWDGTNTPWSGQGGDKLYLQSGQFTSTVKTSEAVSAIDTAVTGISWDGTNTPWSGLIDDKLYLTSGQFTSTVKTSEYIGGVDAAVQGISWDGTNTPWSGQGGDKLYLQSGQFTSTVKTSEAVSAIDITPSCLDTNDVEGRLGVEHMAVPILAPLSLSVESEGIGINISNPPNTAVIIGSELPLSLAQELAETSPTVNIAIPAPLTLSIDQQGIGVNNPPDATVILGSALSLIAAQPTISHSISADIEIMPLALTVDLDLQPPTYIAQGNVFVSMSIPLVLGLTEWSATVSGDTFILLPGVPLSAIPMSLSIHAPEVSITDDVKIIVTNARTFAISEYTGIVFNSMVKFNGKYLYARADGIYEGIGDDDDGADIHASYKTGAFDINATEVQKLRNIFLNFRSDGDIQLFSIGNELNTRWYNIANSTADTMHERRRKFERGIRDNHFSFGISNVAGSSLEIKNAKILTEPIRKRR